MTTLCIVCRDQNCLKPTELIFLSNHNWKIKLKSKLDEWLSFRLFRSFFNLHLHCVSISQLREIYFSSLFWNETMNMIQPKLYSVTHPSDKVDLTLPVRVTLGPWWLTGRSMDSELVCRLVMLWQLNVSLLPADELQAGQGRALDGRESPEAGLEARESVHRSGVLP